MSLPIIVIIENILNLIKNRKWGQRNHGNVKIV
jgi:hypothetical protein